MDGKEPTVLWYYNPADRRFCSNEENYLLTGSPLIGDPGGPDAVHPTPAFPSRNGAGFRCGSLTPFFSSELVGYQQVLIAL
jgi:hypothetical protein